MRCAWLLLVGSLILASANPSEAAVRDALARNTLGADLVKQGKLDEALMEFQQAIALDPRLAAAQANLAYVCDRLGRMAEAIVAYKRAIELDPQNGTLFNNLGVLYTKKGQQEEAVAMLEQGIKIDPSNSLLQKNLEIAQKSRTILQQREDQIADAKKLAQARPKDPQAAYNVARILATYGRNDEALEWLSKASELGYHDLASAKIDPTFAVLKNDPRFQRITEKR
jgi:Flp pilus assembly protein TadD